ncbi:unnamed protein product [Absidia cylindrospora]
MSTATTSAACVDSTSNYHTAFPALQTMPWPSPFSYYHPYSKKRHSIPSSSFQHSISPPKPPSYLKHTQYAALVREQYQYQLQKRYDNTKKLMNDTQQPVQQQQQTRAEQHTLMNNERLEDLDLRLPSFWNSADKSRYLDIDKNGLGASYIGPGKSEDHAGIVRANLPMRNQCGVYYFEMHVKSKGDDGYIGIGFCSAKNELNRLPGWDKLSYGYHGDDGHSFEGSGIGKKYGPQFKTGDVIGCGVNFANKTAFYTKNGTFLGIAFQDLDLSLPVFPCVGMRTAGEYITVNFGQETFVYDIVQYIQEQKLTLWKDIDAYSVPTSPSLISKTEPVTKTCDNINQSVNQLILSYMIHHGYSGSAQALVNDSNYLSGMPSQKPSYVRPAMDDDLQRRLDVKNAVVAGDIDQAIELINIHFPSVLQTQGKNGPILFQLKCQKFVEMISDHSNQEYQRRQSKYGSEQRHQRHFSEADSMMSFSSDDDHMSTLSSSQSSAHDYFDHYQDGISTNSNNSGELGIANEKSARWASTPPKDTFATTTSSGKHSNSSSSWHPVTSTSSSSSSSSRSRSISAHPYHGYSPPIATDISAPGRRMSWAAIVATPASPTTRNSNSNNNNNSHIADGVTPSATDYGDNNNLASSFHSTLRRSSSSSNGYSTCSGLSAILGSGGGGGVGQRNMVLAEQDESQSSDDMDMDGDASKCSLRTMMQTIMAYGQELQDEYGKEPSSMIKEKLKQIFSLLAYPDPRSSPMCHLLGKASRETLASDVNVAILVLENKPETPPLDRLYRQMFTVNKELACFGHGESVLLDLTQDQYPTDHGLTLSSSAFLSN